MAPAPNESWVPGHDKGSSREQIGVTSPESGPDTVSGSVAATHHLRGSECEAVLRGATGRLEGRAVDSEGVQGVPEGDAVVDHPHVSHRVRGTLGLKGTRQAWPWRSSFCHWPPNRRVPCQIRCRCRRGMDSVHPPDLEGACRTNSPRTSRSPRRLQNRRRSRSDGRHHADGPSSLVGLHRADIVLRQPTPASCGIDGVGRAVKRLFHWAAPLAHWNHADQGCVLSGRRPGLVPPRGAGEGSIEWTRTGGVRSPRL